MKVLCGRYWQPLEASFAICPPIDVKPYQNLFGPSFRFNAGETAFCFAAQWLDSEIIGADPELQRVLLRGIGETGKRNLRNEVRGVLAGMMGREPINQVEVASTFGLSKRTLHRRLAALGTHFQDILDEGCEMACQPLGNTSLPLAQIALMVGYSEVSAFTRSFKRRLGCGPGAWRASRAS